MLFSLFIPVSFSPIYISYPLIVFHICCFSVCSTHHWDDERHLLENEIFQWNRPHLFIYLFSCVLSSKSLELMNCLPFAKQNANSENDENTHTHTHIEWQMLAWHAMQAHQLIICKCLEWVFERKSRKTVCIWMNSFVCLPASRSSNIIHLSLSQSKSSSSLSLLLFACHCILFSCGIFIWWTTWWLLRKPLDAATAIAVACWLFSFFLFLLNFFLFICVLTTTMSSRTKHSSYEMKCEKKTKKTNKKYRYAFCLFCSGFRSQEILFIFIEAKYLQRNCSSVLAGFVFSLFYQFHHFC